MNILRVLCVVLLVTGIASTSLAGYTGSLNYSDGVINGTGSPGLNPWLAAGTVFSWDVTDLGSSFIYKYTLTVPEKDISHFIIEVSPSFTEDNILSPNPLEKMVLGTYGPDEPGNSNPGIPDSMKGIKTTEEINNTTYTLTFTSNRAPVWGDFYAKDGTTGGQDKIDIAIWNSGFGYPDVDGLSAGHILVPDSVTPPTAPAPAAIVLGSLGMGLVGLLRRRNSK